VKSSVQPLIGIHIFVPNPIYPVRGQTLNWPSQLRRKERKDFSCALPVFNALATTGTPDEFLAFCGVLGLGYLVADGQSRHLGRLRHHASDSRWRICEAIALGLQQYGRVQPKNLIDVMSHWCLGNPLERRAAIAATCEPELLKNPVVAHRTFNLLDRVTASLVEEDNRRSEDVRALRKTLGYAWSVAVAAQPEVGLARMASWFEQQDPDIPGRLQGDVSPQIDQISSIPKSES